jgi:hypothetical protein
LGEIQTVGGDHVRRPAKKGSAFRRRDLAHGGETVGLPGGGRLHREFGGNVMSGRFPGRRDLGKMPIEIDAGASQRTAEDGGMGGEDGADLRRIFFDCEKAGATHPLVKQRYSLALAILAQHPPQGGNDLAAGIAEHDRLNVVPASRERIHPVPLPELVEKLPLIVFLVEGDENHPGTPGDQPSAESAANLLQSDGFPETDPIGLVGLFECLVVFQIGAKEDVPVAKMVNRQTGFAADDGVDPADFVTHFPTDFEEGVGRGGGSHALPFFGGVVFGGFGSGGVRRGFRPAGSGRRLSVLAFGDRNDRRFRGCRGRPARDGRPGFF